MPVSTRDLNEQRSPGAALARPSLIDRWLRFVQRQRAPYWFTYLILFILESALIHALSWLDGWLPRFTFEPLLLLFPLWLWGPLTILTWLNQTATSVVPDFGRLLELDEEGVESLREEFTTMPTRGVLLSGAFWVAIYVLLSALTYESFYAGFGLGRLAAVTVFTAGLISYSIGSILYYHSLRQLWLVDRTVKRVRRFNLFALDPAYAFARLTSRTGIGWMALAAGTLLIFPLEIARGTVLTFLVLQALLALAAFVLPLRAVNAQLSMEKQGRLADVNRRIQSTVERLHGVLDSGETAEAPPLGGILGALRSERDVLMSISTLPWRAGTLTGFVSATVFSIISVFIQMGVRNLLGG